MTAWRLLTNLNACGRQNAPRRWLTTGCLLLTSLAAPLLARADVIVNEASEAALDAAIAQAGGSGAIIFNCDGTIPITHTKAITANTTLDAGGHSIILNGGGNTRLFDVTGSATLVDIAPYTRAGITISHKWTVAYTTLTLKNLTLANGAAGSGNGGAARLAAGNLIATNCTFRGSRATQGGAISNGIKVFTGAYAVDVIQFIGTSAIYSSAFRGALTLTDCAFDGNTAANGGGIETDMDSTSSTPHTLTLSPSPALTRCAFTNNRATTNGGAILTNSEGPSVTGCTFTGNQAGGSGGAILTSYAGLSASTCTFDGNQAGSLGCAVDAAGSSVFQQCAFDNNGVNSGNGSGGAVLLDGGNSSTFDGCRFLNNHASAYSGGQGGGLLLRRASGVSKVTNCAFLGNSVNSLNGGAAQGGGLYMDSACSIANCTVAGNTAQCGEFVPASSALAVGGGIYNGGTTVISNCTIAGNRAIVPTDSYTNPQNAAGGGIDNYYMASLTLVNTIVANNTIVMNSRNTFIGSNANGPFTDGGHNICSDFSFYFDPASTSLNNTDPLLGPLVYTGGATPTLSLLPGSPAIDAGDDTQAPTTDQRGAARVGVSDIGAYERPLWQADAVASAPDGTTRVLWNRKDGLCNLWSVDASGSVTQSFTYGPLSGFSAAGVSVGGDNNTRLLWRGGGAATLYNVNTSGGNGQILSTTAFGPFAGWTAANISAGADNNTRLLWTNQDGRADLWNVDTNAAAFSAQVISSTHFGPYAGWTAAGISVGGDNLTRLLWTNQDGRIDLWNVYTGYGTDAALLLSSTHFGPFAGWTAAQVGQGADGLTRLLWSNLDGTRDLWTLNLGGGTDNASLLSSWHFGAFSGFACNGLSVGADNSPRMLWNRSDGLLNLWSVDGGSGSVLASFNFGPR